MSEDMLKLIIQAAVSGVMLLAGLAVLIFDLGDPTLQKAAAGWIGVVTGFWLQ